MTWVLDSTRIKQTFLRPTSDKGTSVPFWTTGFRRFCVTAVWGFFSLAAFGAFTPPPKEAAKALKVTRGKPFSHGLVFVDGKFIEPPYVVERYGNVIRINKIQVTNQIYEWGDFLKTQSGAVVSRKEVPSSAPVAAPPPIRSAPVAPAVEDEYDPLDALFDDLPAKPKKTVTAASRPASVRPPEPKTVTTVKFDGAFEANAKTSIMVNKINKMRYEIDVALRRGSFMCFGSGYSRVMGDAETARKILQKLPEIMKNNSEYTPFAAAVRDEGFVFFPQKLVKELFEHRVDYILLQKWWKKVFDEQELNNMLERAGVKDY